MEPAPTDYYTTGEGLPASGISGIVGHTMPLITRFDPWKNKLCACPDKYSLSPYTGCGHGCLYCYASSYIKNFSQPRAKKDFLIRLDKEIKKLPADSTIAIANSSDPYQPLEKKLKLMSQALKILKNYAFKINIVTKSSLILRDLDIIKNLKEITVCLSLTTLNESLAKKLEPYACLPQARLETIKELSKYIPVSLRLDPLIYPLNTDKIEKLIKAAKTAGAKQIITSTYKLRPDNFKKMIGIFGEYKNLWEKLYFMAGENKNGYTYLPEQTRKELIEHIRKLTEKESLKFSSCREGFADLNTANCDGT